jgi:hypothetical protein
MTTRAIYDVVVQIHPPSGDYPGQVCEGKFTHEDNVVTLVDHNGLSLKGYTKKINPDENPVVVARPSNFTSLAAVAKISKDSTGPSIIQNFPRGCDFRKEDKTWQHITTNTG